MFRYDVFISYKSQYKDWIEVLALNLRSQNLSVFLDDWEFIGGKSIIEEMNRGLEQSKNGILLATPEVLQSSWVKDEYYKMKELADKRDFKIIPIILGKEIPEIPFLSTIKCIDFRDDRYYQKSFHQLICALRDEPPGSPKKFQCRLETPPPLPDSSHCIEISGRKVVEEVFELLVNKQAVLLFVQRDRLQVLVDSYFYARAVKRFGADNVLHLVPPFGPDADMAIFYSELGKKHNFLDQCTSSLAFENAINQRLE